MTKMLQSRWGIPVLLLVTLALAIALGAVAGAGGEAEPQSAGEAATTDYVAPLPAAPAPRPTVAGGRDPFAIPGGGPVTYTPAPVPTTRSTTYPTTSPTPYPSPYPTSKGKEGTVSNSGTGGAATLGGQTIKVVSVDPKLGAAMVEIDGKRVLLQLGDGSSDHYLVEISDNCAGIRSYVSGQEVKNTICAGESVEIITR